MKKIMTIVIVIALAITFVSCDALDMVLAQDNLFGTSSAVTSTEICEANTEALITLSESPSFYNTLAEDPSLVNDVLTTIDDEMSVLRAEALPADATTEQRAEIQSVAALGANVLLETSGGSEVVNNIVGVLVNGSIPEDVDGNLDIESLFSQIAPSVVEENSYDGSFVVKEDEFINLIDSMVAANMYFTTIGAYTDPEVDELSGDIAQAAIVTAVVSSMIPPTESGSCGQYLYDVITGVNPIEDVTVDFETIFAEGTALNNILLASGIDFQSLMGSSN